MKSVNAPPVSQFGTRRTDWDKVLREVDALARKGDKWAVVGTYHRSTASKIRRGDYPKVDPAVYEVTTSKGLLYMRRRDAKPKGQ